MDRFYDKIKVTPTCHLWQSAKRSGYGAIKIKGKVRGAHQVAYELSKGPIPKGMDVCHTCDNPACVNPDHLFLGTRSDNMVDCRDKDRLVIPRGEHVGFQQGVPNVQRSLTDDEVVALRRVINTRGKKTLRVISEEMEVPYQTVRDLSCGRIYASIPGA